ncbi:hypothetical protein [Novipirellula artificiosorum]|nr:hypothetical protein [Novipirellula artificiosorum]
MLRTVAMVVFALVASSAFAIENHDGKPNFCIVGEERVKVLPGRTASDTIARSRFAPMWRPVPKFFQATDAESALPVPSATYAMIWQPQWQEEIGVSAEQRKTLLAINTSALAEASDQAVGFKKLSPEQQQAEVKSWAGKSAPWRRKLDNKIRVQIESVLTPQQLQTLRDFSFPRYAVGSLYDAETRREIDVSPHQEDQLRRIAEERLALLQAVSIDQAGKQWGMLTPVQQASLPELVKCQGPTSAILSIAWELGFDLDRLVPGYPMLAAAPVREHLGLSAAQEEQLNAITEESAARRENTRQEKLSGKAATSDTLSKWEATAKLQVEAILTPRQLATFNEIEFRRKAALALGYPEKREKVGMTEQQFAAFQRLDKETHQRRYRIDCEMLARALGSLSPRQQERLREKIDRKFYGKTVTGSE